MAGLLVLVQRRRSVAYVDLWDFHGSLPIFHEKHLQLNEEHCEQRPVDDNLKDDERPLPAAVLFVHGVQNVPMLPSNQYQNATIPTIAPQAKASRINSSSIRPHIHPEHHENGFYT